MLKSKVLYLLLLFFAVFSPFFSGSVAPPTLASSSRIPCVPDVSIKNLTKANRQYRVGLQAGHWNAPDLPEELAKLRTNTGAYGGGKYEWEVNHRIAHLTAELLRAKGIIVDILPATIPPRYSADVFIAVHADQNPDATLSGFKSSGFRKDATGRGRMLSSIMDQEYTRVSCMRLDTLVTNNMRSYYAFSHDRFEHAISRETVGIIVETGFMSNKSDLDMLLNRPEVAAAGIANGIIKYLNANNT